MVSTLGSGIGDPFNARSIAFLVDDHQPVLFQVHHILPLSSRKDRVDIWSLSLAEGSCRAGQQDKVGLLEPVPLHRLGRGYQGALVLGGESRKDPECGLPDVLRDFSLEVRRLGILWSFCLSGPLSSPPALGPLCLPESVDGAHLQTYRPGDPWPRGCGECASGVDASIYTASSPHLHHSNS